MRCPKGTPTTTMRLTSCSARSCLVQVQHESEWGSICGRGVGPAAAKLICKEMGFPGVERVEEAGRGSGRIWLSDLSCVGDEISATMCSHREWGNIGTCNHLNDLGVCCSGKRNTAQICLTDCCCSLHVLRDRFSRSNLATGRHTLTSMQFTNHVSKQKYLRVSRFQSVYCLSQIVPHSPLSWRIVFLLVHFLSI